MALNDELIERLKIFGQEHLLAFYHYLDEDLKAKLLGDIKNLNMAMLQENFKKFGSDQPSCQLLLEPPAEKDCGSALTCSLSDLKKYTSIGLEAISENQLAVLVLAGGRGTRLGVSYPKGMFDIGLPSGKTLFQLQAEKLLAVAATCKQVYGKETVIYWYIMTSEHTRLHTEQFFESNNYFGLHQEHCVFFEQSTLPALSCAGKVLLKSKHELLRTPDGNGGLFQALRQKGILDHMQQHGIFHLHVYCVDNILVKMADPVFIGFCIDKGVECGAKVKEKKLPTESVGVIVRVGGSYSVLEYSEISSEVAEKRVDASVLTSPLLFRSGNICNHYFSLLFLQRVCQPEFINRMSFHIARKKISHLDPISGDHLEPNLQNAIVLEKFVFDVFRFARTFALWEIDAAIEFSPLKNASSAVTDSPATCRRDYLLAGMKFLSSKGCELVDGAEVEVSPFVYCIDEQFLHIDGDPPTNNGKYYLDYCGDRLVLMPMQ